MILVYFSQFGQTTYDHFSSVDMQLQPCRRADPVVHDKSDGQEASSIGAIASQPFPCRKGAQVADSAAPLIVGSSSPEASHTSNMQNMQRMGRFQPRPTPPEPNCGGLHAVQSREWAPASSFLRAENAVSLRWAFQNLDLHTQRYYIYISHISIHIIQNHVKSKIYTSIVIVHISGWQIHWQRLNRPFWGRSFRSCRWWRGRPNWCDHSWMRVMAAYTS